MSGQTDDPAREAAYLLARLLRLAGRDSRGTPGLNPAQWEALRYVARANRFSRTPTAVAAYFGATRGTISQTLIALEEKGLIAKVRDSGDRRSVSLKISAEGLRVLAHDPAEALADVLQQAAGRDIASVRDHLRRAMTTALRAGRHRPFGFCRACLHFRASALPNQSEPNHCALLSEPLSDFDGELICVEQQPKAA